MQKICPACKNLIPLKLGQLAPHMIRQAETPEMCPASGRYIDKNDFMTVGELIEILQTLDPAALIEIPVQTYTQAYPSHYVQAPFRIQHAHDEKIRIWCHLPEGFIISERRKK